MSRDTNSIPAHALTRVLKPSFPDEEPADPQQHHTQANKALVDHHKLFPTESPDNSFLSGHSGVADSDTGSVNTDLTTRPAEQPPPTDHEAIQPSRQDELHSELPTEEVTLEDTQRDSSCADATTSPAEQPPPALVLYDYEKHGGRILRPVPVQGHKPWEDLVRVKHASLETWSVRLGDIVTVCLYGGIEGYAKVSDLREVGDGRYMVVYTWLYTRREIIGELKHHGRLSKASRKHVNRMWPTRAFYDYMLSCNRTLTLWDTALSLAPHEVVERLCRTRIYITTDSTKPVRKIHPIDSTDYGWVKEILDLSPAHGDTKSAFEFRRTTDGEAQGFEFGVPITSWDIEIVKKRDYLHAAHIQFFNNYLQAQISAGRALWKPYFFGPDTEESIRAGWERIYKQQDLETATAIAACDYLIFPLCTGDHWFLAIVSQFKHLCQGGKGEIYVLDSKSNDHNDLRKDLVKVVSDATKAANSDGAECGHIGFYQAFPETLPQQSEDLCGFYLMAYLEAFATDPDALLDRIRQKSDGGFQPGCLDKCLPRQFLELINRFLSAEERQEQLYDEHGQLIIDGKLSNLLIEVGSVPHKAKRRKLH